MYDCPVQHAHFTYKFTGKERDQETGLDYFGARFNSSSMGRFMSPDGPLLDQEASDPQSWNLYSYVRRARGIGTCEEIGLKAIPAAAQA